MCGDAKHSTKGEVQDNRGTRYRVAEFITVLVTQTNVSLYSAIGLMNKGKQETSQNAAKQVQNNLGDYTDLHCF